MPTDNDFMKFMEDKYNVKFIDAKVMQNDKNSHKDGESQITKEEFFKGPKKWVGLYSSEKRDAMYYKKCLEDMREIVQDSLESCVVSKKVEEVECFTFEQISRILSHEYELDGVDLDKPNFGMF